MPDVMMHEIYSVAVQVDSSYPDTTRIRPSCVWFDTWEEASAAVARALALLPADITTAMVSRERVEAFDHDESGDLDDWPAQRHVVTGPYTREDFE